EHRRKKGRRRGRVDAQSALSGAFTASPIQNNSDLAQGPQGYSGELFCSSPRQVTSGNLRKPCRNGGSKTKRLTPRSTLGSGKLGDRTMSSATKYKSEMPLSLVLHFASRALKPLWFILA